MVKWLCVSMRNGLTAGPPCAISPIRLRTDAPPSAAALAMKCRRLSAIRFSLKPRARSLQPRLALRARPAEIVTGAGDLAELPPWPQLEKPFGDPGLRQRLRVFEREVDLQMVEVA